MNTRKEVDSLGEKDVPTDAYYGIQTLRAVENFPVSGIKAPRNFVRAYIYLKKAAALANMEIGWLNDKIGKAIIESCDEILDGKFSDQFVVDVFQAGAGTSFNMNVNEVLANRALEILGKKVKRLQIEFKLLFSRFLSQLLYYFSSLLRKLVLAERISLSVLHLSLYQVASFQ